MIDLTPACDEMARVLSAIDDDRLDAPTPCAEYTVAELIGHVDDAARNFAAMARGDGEPAARADDRHGVVGHVRELAVAWSREGAWTGVSEGAGVKLPNERWAKIALTEMVVHVWDLQKSLGRPFAMPEETLKACWEHVAEFVPQAPIPSLWAPPVPVPDDAPLIDRIVGITGRVPSWSA